MQTLGKVLVVILFALLGFCFGGASVASLITLTTFAYVAFCVVLFSDAKNNLKGLLRFIPFIFGVLFLAHLAGQSFNIWLTFDNHGYYNNARFIEFCKFLPAGVFSGQRDLGFLWENFLGATLALMTVCTLRLCIKTEFDSTRFVRFLFFLIVIISTFAMCYAFAFADSNFIWGIVDKHSGTPYGSFYYKNQMGAYMIMGGICGLSSLADAWRERFEFPILILHIFGLLLITASIFFSNSIGSLCVWIALLGVSFFYILLRYPPRNFGVKKIICVGIFCLALIPAGVLLTPTIMDSPIGQRLQKAQESKTSIEKLSGLRKEFRILAFDMIINCGSTKCEYSSAEISRLLLGNGANSFGYVSQIWDMEKFPKLAAYASGTNKVEISLLKKTHCDILQFVFEYGLLWSLAVVVIFAYWLWKILRRGAFSNPPVFIMVLGLVFILGYSYFDIILYNNVIFAMFASLVVLAYEMSKSAYSD